MYRCFFGDLCGSWLALSASVRRKARWILMRLPIVPEPVHRDLGHIQYHQWVALPCHRPLIWLALHASTVGAHAHVKFDASTAHPMAPQVSDNSPCGHCMRHNESASPSEAKHIRPKAPTLSCSARKTRPRRAAQPVRPPDQCNQIDTTLQLWHAMSRPAVRCLLESTQLATGPPIK